MIVIFLRIIYWINNRRSTCNMRFLANHYVGTGVSIASDTSWCSDGCHYGPGHCSPDISSGIRAVFQK